MLILKRIVALAIIATFLASIPLAFADNNARVIRVSYELKVDTNSAKPSGTGGAKVEPSYVLIAQGLMTTPANLYFAPNSEDSGFFAAIANSIVTYESYAGELFQDPVSQTGLVGGVRDYKNVLVFGDLGSSNTIAVTYAWITRGRTKWIVEFDIVFNTQFDWGNAGDTSDSIYPVGFMDTENIVTHEMGHAVGLGDLYQSQNAKATMFGYASNGETWKRTLAAGDVAGLAALYP
jgi:hypothetical protein